MVFSVPNELLLTSCQLSAQIRRDDTERFVQQSILPDCKLQTLPESSKASYSDLPRNTFDPDGENIAIRSWFGVGEGGLRHERKVK